MLFTGLIDPVIPRVDQAALDPAGIRQPWTLPTSDHPTPCSPLVRATHTARTSPLCSPPKALLPGRTFSQKEETNRKVPSYFLHHFQVSDE